MKRSDCGHVSSPWHWQARRTLAHQHSSFTAYRAAPSWASTKRSSSHSGCSGWTGAGTRFPRSLFVLGSISSTGSGPLRFLLGMWSAGTSSAAWRCPKVGACEDPRRFGWRIGYVGSVAARLLDFPAMVLPRRRGFYDLRLLAELDLGGLPW